MNMEKQRMKWKLREERGVQVYWDMLGESQRQLHKCVWVLWQRSMRIPPPFLCIQPIWWCTATCICIIGWAWSQGFWRSHIWVCCQCWPEVVEVGVMIWLSSYPIDICQLLIISERLLFGTTIIPHIPTHQYMTPIRASHRHCQMIKYYSTAIAS